jgi:hypothetical protein
MIMSDEQTPDVEDIKIRLGDDIPVEEDPAAFKAEEESVDVVDELRNVGRQFGETLSTAWNSEERRQFESEVREGVSTFTHEVDKTFREFSKSDAAEKAKSEAEGMKSKIDSSDMSDSARTSFAKSLQWFSQELSKLADQFTPPEKAPPEDETTE